MELGEAAAEPGKPLAQQQRLLAPGRTLEEPLRQGVPSAQLKLQFLRDAGVRTHCSGVPTTPKGLCS